jgi:hypothetical protein
MKAEDLDYFKGLNLDYNCVTIVHNSEKCDLLQGQEHYCIYLQCCSVLVQCRTRANGTTCCSSFTYHLLEDVSPKNSNFLRSVGLAACHLLSQPLKKNLIGDGISVKNFLFIIKNWSTKTHNLKKDPGSCIPSSWFTVRPNPTTRSPKTETPHQSYLMEVMPCATTLL